MRGDWKRLAEQIALTSDRNIGTTSPDKLPSNYSSPISSLP